jgi:hypothetical protein
MVKPRIFVSSTYYDLKYVRESLGKFITDLGFDPVIFEEGHIAHIPGQNVDLSCYSEVKNCHILVLIIGRRYGSPSSMSANMEGDESNNKYESITVTEFQTAHNKNIPIYIFIEEEVLSAYKIHQQNKEREVSYPSVDNIQVFDFIDKVYSLNKYWIKAFENIDDIINELRNQWAGLFANYLISLQHKEQLKTISEKREVENIKKDMDKKIRETIAQVERENIMKARQMGYI